MPQTLQADQPVWFRTDYCVCDAGTYDDSALVLCYATGDPSKIALVQFQSLYVATGRHVGDDMPPANVQTFESAVWLDQNIPVSAKLALVTFFPLVEKNIDNPTFLQEGWQGLVSVYGSSWLTPAVQSIVEHYATANGVMLVAES